jgi:hypothetical protein
MGFSWYQEPAGKIWWTMVTGRLNEAGPDGERFPDKKSDFLAPVRAG